MAQEPSLRFILHGSHQQQVISSLLLTVVLIHMRQATFAPIAHAPAVPPLIADFAALSNTSENESSSFTAFDIFVSFIYF